MRYWLMKSEPDVYSINDLENDGKTLWEGVRNYQARNFMQKDMQIGDQILFYHSNAEPPGVAGVARVSGLAVPDPSQFERKSEYHDSKATKEKPIWYCVQVEFVRSLPRFVTLSDLRAQKDLKDMFVLAKGQRLSVQPVTAKEFDRVCRLGQAEF